jgi:hypothetical protein
LFDARRIVGVKPPQYRAVKIDDRDQQGNRVSLGVTNG